MSYKAMGIDTRAVHAGENELRVDGAVSLPIFQTAMYETASDEERSDLRYIRYSNSPNHEALHRKLASLEGGEAALVSSSGMGAISAALLTVLKPGDHLLAQDCLYGGTRAFITQALAEMNVSVDFLDSEDSAAWRQKLRPSTKAIYCEAMTNPTLQVIDLEAVTALAREAGIVSMIDATFATPCIYRPLEHGFDLALHSCTKYLNGHSDIVAGAVVGAEALIKRIRTSVKFLGSTLDPHACFLLQRGIKTLGLRMERHNHSALTIAQALEVHPAVEKVNYPGLPSHRQHERAARLFNGFGGMLSFTLCDGLAAARRLLRSVAIPLIAPSLGGVETLMTLPAETSHATLEPAERARLGISDGLIRMSVGIESAEDIVADLEQALA